MTFLECLGIHRAFAAGQDKMTCRLEQAKNQAIHLLVQVCQGLPKQPLVRSMDHHLVLIKFFRQEKLQMDILKQSARTRPVPPLQHVPLVIWRR